MPMHTHRSSCQRGMVLITTLLLLVVVTMLALAMFRGIGLENRIAGNVLDKQRALQAADSAQEYGEEWLFNNVSPANPYGVDCADSASYTIPQLCTLPLVQQVDGGQVADPPWTVNHAAAGYSYSANVTTSSSGGANTLYSDPVVYMGYLGRDGTFANAYDYTVDAWSHGGSDATVAVVESTYQVRLNVANASSP